MIHSGLERARAEAAEAKRVFLLRHKETCLAFGRYCQAMEEVQSLTSDLFQPGLGGNPEAEGLLRGLLIKESPVLTAKREGPLDVTRGWGFDLRTDCVPLVRV
jgi:hypothetical protein